jgi:hypothetical protein
MTVNDVLVNAIFLLILWAPAALFWIANIFKIAWRREGTGWIVVRVIGIFIPPLRVLLGIPFVGGRRREPLVVVVLERQRPELRVASAPGVEEQHLHFAVELQQMGRGKISVTLPTPPSLVSSARRPLSKRSLPRNPWPSGDGRARAACEAFTGRSAGVPLRLRVPEQASGTARRRQRRSAWPRCSRHSPARRWRSRCY